LFHPGGDGKLRVYDSENGRVLWTGDMPAGSRGIPAMYEVNGRQFFVVSATATIAGTDTTDQNAPAPVRAYVAYALPEKGSPK
jgi:quinoprotein glucose dehydrogenase